MFEVRFSKRFTKQYNRLPEKQRKQAKARIIAWSQDPSGRQYNDHSLAGKYRGYNSINITGDMRALYYQQGETIIIFAFIGTHSQLYGK